MLAVPEQEINAPHGAQSGQSNTRMSVTFSCLYRTSPATLHRIHPISAQIASLPAILKTKNDTPSLSRQVGQYWTTQVTNIVLRWLTSTPLQCKLWTAYQQDNAVFQLRQRILSAVGAAGGSPPRRRVHRLERRVKQLGQLRKRGPGYESCCEERSVLQHAFVRQLHFGRGNRRHADRLETGAYGMLRPFLSDYIFVRTRATGVIFRLQHCLVEKLMAAKLTACLQPMENSFGEWGPFNRRTDYFLAQLTMCKESAGQVTTTASRNAPIAAPLAS